MVTREEGPGETMSPFGSDFGTGIQVPGSAGLSSLGSTCDGWEMVFCLA